MSERFIFTRHRTRCYHCGEDADQIIKAVSAQAQVICSACGATRIFIPRFENTGVVRDLHADRALRSMDP